MPTLSETVAIATTLLLFIYFDDYHYRLNTPRHYYYAIRHGRDATLSFHYARCHADEGAICRRRITPIRVLMMIPLLRVATIGGRQHYY